MAANPLRMDPTRTASLRRAFERQLTLRFRRLKAKLFLLLVDEDALGLLPESHHPFALHPTLRTAGNASNGSHWVANCGGVGGKPGPCPSVKEAAKAFQTVMAETLARLKFGVMSPQVAEGEIELAKGDFRSTVGGKVESTLLRVRRALRGAGKGEQFPGIKAEVLSSLDDFYEAIKTRGADVGDVSKEDRYWNRKEVTSRLKKVGENLAWARRVAGLTANEMVEDRLEQMMLNCGGPGSGVPGPCPSPPKGDSPNEVTDSYISKARSILARVPGASWLQGKLKSLNDGLTQRYGKRQALAIVASGQAFGWGLSIVGTAVTGVPVYVPFSTVVGMVPGAALAELHYRLKGSAKSEAVHNIEHLSEHDIAEQGQQLVRQLIDLWSSRPEDVKSLTANAGRWQFASDPEKVKQFKVWLKTQLLSDLIGKAERDLWDAYVREGLKKGAGRAFDDTRRPQKVRDELAGRPEFYAGTREEFLRSSFHQPVAIEKAQLLAARSFDEMEGVTGTMGTRMARTLTDGLVKGDSPREIARDLDNELDIGRNRSLVIARTEIVRAHAEGQLMALEQLGVEEVGVAVEWSTTGDDKVCELCQPLEGVVLKISEAKGMLPRHPNCRCAWVPANVGEADQGQKDTKASIGRALDLSVEREGGDDKTRWAGADLTPSKARPQSIVGNADYLTEFSRAMSSIKG